MEREEHTLWDQGTDRFHGPPLPHAGRARRYSALLLVACASLAPSCATVPVTGRRQLNVLSIQDDIQLGAQAYTETISASKTLDSGPEYEQVRRVVDRLIAVTDDPGFDWEVHVIDDPETVNAWCMPGGKMAVYTGILPVTADDTGLAVVMGHEIGHAVARHGTERMTHQLGTSTVIEILAGEHTELASQAASLLIGLPWGRKQELESDRIGLIYMARAGYDPRQAADFWKRMSALGGEAPPELLSTHPADETRIAQIEKYLPEALKIYEESGQGADSR